MPPTRMTPVQAAKVVGIRPQIVYGYIKSGRLGTFPNPDGNTALVDVDSVKTLAAGTKHHRQKDPLTGQPVKRTAGVERGTILSYHGETKGAKKRHAHRVTSVDEVIKGDDGSPALIYTTKSDGGSVGIIYETERLADAIAKGKCHIETPEHVLAVVMFHYTHSGKAELAASLDMWCYDNNIQIPDISEKEGEVATVETHSTDTAFKDADDELSGEE